MVLALPGQFETKERGNTNCSWKLSSIFTSQNKTAFFNFKVGSSEHGFEIKVFHFGFVSSITICISGLSMSPISHGQKQQQNISDYKGQFEWN